ncbi:unnamed protein product, partial [Staurois parvus]
MGPPTDPGPSGSARVSKWSVRPCLQIQRRTNGKTFFWRVVTPFSFFLLCPNHWLSVVLVMKAQHHMGVLLCN